MSVSLRELMVAGRWSAIEAEKGFCRLTSRAVPDLAARKAFRTAYLAGIEQCFNFSALPREVQLVIAESLSEDDLYCLSRTSRVMQQMIANHAFALEGAFHSRNVGSEELLALQAENDAAAAGPNFRLAGKHIKLHPVFEEVMWYHFTLATKWETAWFDSSDMGISGPVKRYALRDLAELGENATSPPCSAVRVKMWNLWAERSFIEAWGGDRYSVGEDQPDDMATVKNEDGRPLSVEQLLRAMCEALVPIQKRIRRRGPSASWLKTHYINDWSSRKFVNGRLPIEAEWEYGGGQ